MRQGVTNENIEAFLNKNNLDETQKQLLFVPLSEVEIKHIILKMASNKIPGLNRFSTETYKTFIDLWMPNLCHEYEEIFNITGL